MNAMHEAEITIGVEKGQQNVAVSQPVTGEGFLPSHSLSPSLFKQSGSAAAA